MQFVPPVINLTLYRQLVELAETSHIEGLDVIVSMIHNFADVFNRKFPELYLSACRIYDEPAEAYLRWRRDEMYAIVKLDSRCTEGYFYEMRSLWPYCPPDPPKVASYQAGNTAPNGFNTIPEELERYFKKMMLVEVGYDEV